MTRTYRVTRGVRVINQLAQALIRLGLGPQSRYLLTVSGRKTGQPYTTPHGLALFRRGLTRTIVEHNHTRWLVAPYGEVNWVRNARAAGRVTLRRGRRVESVSVIEVEPQARAPILQKYLRLEPVTQPYFEARPESPLDAFAAEAMRHPVFRIQEQAGV